MYSTSLLIFTLLLTLASPAPAPSATASYTLIDNCSGASFLSCFDFFSSADPTHGFVHYLNQADAQAQNLFTITDDTVKISVDSTNITPDGRASVRLQSKKLYNRGLFVLDLVHMPASTCGSWPSFWTLGSAKPWPENGEIDIIEAVNTDTTNHMTLHTSDGCSITGAGGQGRVVTQNCFVGAAGQPANAGCGVESASAASFGSPVNAAGGGVYAMEWTAERIAVWFFPRGSVMGDLVAGTPDPSTWGPPDASFQGDCDLSTHFVDHSLLIDTTFCGDWAGSVWSSNPICSALAPTCADYVANNPAAFAESYWQINSLKIFSQW
ncbi:hypothetical protein P280DRAFT_395567 [Massarina eburnea CBS 473.64]|uniref:endo-1,3(4)-beta-glucanase n=1 Tax=Massarina eburnea CBS 473.64 TaxID=1395130 RepID=A0A6A6S3G8_9PLEO|nr:hypothetical protein P280DRAFT_395567 [Massarina eburnea CBS 473.64]